MCADILDETPEEVSEWMRKIQAKRKTKSGGRKKKYDDEAHRKNRERVAKHRKAKKQQEARQMEPIQEILQNEIERAKNATKKYEAEGDETLTAYWQAVTQRKEEQLAQLNWELEGIAKEIETAEQFISELKEERRTTLDGVWAEVKAERTPNHQQEAEK